jgi:hypothetical protein
LGNKFNTSKVAPPALDIARAVDNAAGEVDDSFGDTLLPLSVYARDDCEASRPNPNLFDEGSDAWHPSPTS